MASITKKVRISLKLDNGKTKQIQLNAAPISANMINPDTGDNVFTEVFPTIRAVYEDADGATIDSASVYLVTTTTDTIITDYSPD